jgi:hypothetical protein
MSVQTSRSNLLGRRGALMAELFLQDLGPEFISRPTSDVGYDLLVGFSNKRGGINTFAVEVKSTEQPPGPKFQLLKHVFVRLSCSNIPSLLLVADVKQNRMYYAWLDAKIAANGGQMVSIPIIELDNRTTKKLKAEFEKPSSVLTAG